MNSKFIYAKKGLQKTVFTPMIWENMGRNKNEWVAISEAEYKGEDVINETPKDVKEAMAAANADNGKEATNEPPKEVDVDVEYDKLYKMGSGLAKDKKYEAALVKYEAAQKLKDTPTIKGRITSMKKLIEAAELENARKELVATAEAAVLDKDYEGALEAYEAAYEMKVTDDVKAKIEEVKALQADELVN